MDDWDRAFAALNLPAPRRPRHPEYGCPCVACESRDEAAERIAEQRRDDRSG